MASPATKASPAPAPAPRKAPPAPAPRKAPTAPARTPRTGAPANASLAGYAKGQAAAAPPRVALGAPSAEEVLLKGTGTFAPTKPVADLLATHPRGGGDVNVRFPGLASGTIKVNERNGRYSTPSELQAIDLQHAALEPLRSVGIAPMLAVKIQDSTITGFVTVSTGKKPLPSPMAVIETIGKQATALGWLGMSGVAARKQANKLEAGTLTLSTDIGFTLGGFLNGKGTFGFTDDVVAFAANTKAGVKGLGEVSLDAERRTDGTIHGRAEIPVAIKGFSGKLVVVLAAGVVEITGTAKYTTEKLTGEVTFLVTDAKTARTVAYQHLPPEAIEASAQEAAGGAAAAPTAAGPKPGPRAVAGWGTLDASFNEWLTGKAMVIVDAEGHVTVVGKITPPAKVEFNQTKLDYEKKIFGFEVRAAYGVPVIGNVFLFAGVSLFAIARISPLTLSKIEIVGTYSTDPTIFNSFSLSANLNISALAALKLRAEGGVGVEILEHDIKIGAAVNAMAGIKGYVDATPVIGYRELADPKVGRRGEFYIHGEAVLAAQPFLGLSGDLFVQLDSPWWSPAPDKTWTWPLGQLEYPLPGEFGFGADVDYVFGSGKLPSITPKKVDFNADRFMTELMDDKVASGSTGEQKKKGAWNEKQKAPPVPPAPPQIVDTKGKGKKKDDEKVKDDGKSWAEGMKAVAALKKRGETKPYTAAELGPELNKIKAKHGFGVLEPKMAGDSWEIAASRGKDTLKKPLRIKRAAGGPAAAGPGGKLPDVDRPVTLAREAHVIRAHREGSRLVILMSSDRFLAVDEEIKHIQTHIVDTFLDQESRPAEAKIIADKLALLRQEKDGWVARYASAPEDKREQVVNDGMKHFAAQFAVVNQGLEIYIGPWATIRVGDVVLYKVGKRDDFGMVVRIMQRVGGMFGLHVRSVRDDPAGTKVTKDRMATWQEATGERPRSGAGQTFLAYDTYKTRWERASGSIPLLPGSRDNPFLLAQWPKPAWDAYPTLYFAGPATKVSQKSLEARFKAGDPTVVPYYPRGGVLGPNMIGIQLPYRIKAGKDPIGPITNKTSPGGDKLARLLKPYGYDSVNDGLECDHIQDVQVGGIDAVQNLWPLARSINGPAGGRLHGSKLLFPDRKSDVPLKDLKLATTMQFFFRIEKTL